MALWTHSAMSGWRAVVPFKGPGTRKSRLAPFLGAMDRERVAEAMLTHVLATLNAVPEISEIDVLAPAPLNGFGWCCDKGSGLNQELMAVRARYAGQPMMFVHADLPELAVADVEQLLSEACGGRAALAPDRHGRGTNAIALPADRTFRFCFGHGSLELHAAQGEVALVVTPGLSRDIDTVDDLRAQYCLEVASGPLRTVSA